MLNNMKDKIKQFEIPYQISYEDALNYQICKETDKEYLECANNFYRNIFEKINENMTSYHFFDSLKFGASEINHNTGLLIRKDCTSYLGKIIKKLGVNVGAKKCRLENFKYEQQKLRKLRESNNQDDTVEERYKNLELRVIKRINSNKFSSTKNCYDFILLHFLSHEKLKLIEKMNNSDIKNKAQQQEKKSNQIMLTRYFKYEKQKVSQIPDQKQILCDIKANNIEVIKIKENLQQELSQQQTQSQKFFIANELKNYEFQQNKPKKQNLNTYKIQDEIIPQIRNQLIQNQEQEEEKAQYQEEKYDQKEQQEEEDYQQTQYLEEYQQTQYQEEQNEQKQVEEEYQETQYLEDQQTQQEEEQCQEKQCSKEQKEQRCQEENIVCDEINSNTMLEEEIKSLIYDLQQSQQQSQQLLELDKNVFRKDETLLEIIQRKNSQQDLNNNQQQFSIKNQHHSLLDNSKKFQCESNNQPVNMSNQIKQEYKDQKPKDDQFTSHKEKLENQIKDLKYQLLKTKLQIAQQQMKMFFTQYPDYIPQDSQSQQDLCYYQ
ncbi:hypothetical protein TTHERM_00249580 (macronuclear) [Tetrahymena thermophila SB210]|uniref:Uncharacterized protein n=1 Tax=Tetrahymena thermophila (strain SB210) TaxID=312017 RepID=Q23QX5_TETTS|nr:hypothetical protein TTHERM_00249580 [Tetrahymena thermophila SB210]EAR98763.2 hypothetical protein TTHERM_00249580 [Tetrahymena thermophila SB210]|eukprot:XP_001019008.2 hypothetical protein TTHERM_00249580 [Tetrahymena thermophila SB210]